MEDVNRKVVFFGTQPNHNVRCAIQKQIEKWIELKKGNHAIEKESRYHVCFERNSTDNSYFCHAKIQIGMCEWQCHDIGKTIEEALFLALKHPTISFVRPDLLVQHINQSQTVGVA